MENLTKAEKRILELILEGLSNKEIANTLCISQHTVKAHLEHIYDKFEIHNRIQLVIKLLKNKN